MHTQEVIWMKDPGKNANPLQSIPKLSCINFKSVSLDMKALYQSF